MKKYYSFIMIALIGFLINIFLLFNFNNLVIYRKELLYIEFMVLLAVIVAIKTFYNSRGSDFMAIIFFIIFTINALFVFNRVISIMTTALLLISVYGLIFFMKQSKSAKKKRRKTTTKAEEIKTLIGEESDISPKIIIEKKKFVATKYGKLFYKEGAQQLKRVKKGNKIYFETAAQAKKAGYKEFKG